MKDSMVDYAEWVLAHSADAQQLRDAAQIAQAYGTSSNQGQEKTNEDAV